jgi:hypothetical protein
LLPEDAVEACEALMQEMVAKYPVPKWPTISAEDHLAALHRHAAGWERGETDPESGLSHAVHVAVRALMLLAVERDKGRLRGDPLRAATAAVRRAQQAVAAIAPEGAAWDGQIHALIGVDAFLGREAKRRQTPRSLDCTSGDAA